MAKKNVAAILCVGIFICISVALVELFMYEPIVMYEVSGESTASVVEKVNLNTADLQELMRIPGVGEVMAQRFIDFRKKIGRISYVEELLEVEGIGEKKLDDLIPYVEIED